MHYAMEGSGIMAGVIILGMSKFSYFSFLTRGGYVNFLCAVLFSVSLWGLIYLLIFVRYRYQDRKENAEMFQRKSVAG